MRRPQPSSPAPSPGPRWARVARCWNRKARDPRCQGRAAASDADGPAGSERPHMSRKRTCKNCVHTDDAGVAEEAGAGAPPCQAVEVRRAVAKENHTARRQEHGRDGERLERQFLRQNPEQCAARGATDVGPVEYSGRGGSRKPHGADDRWHPLEDEIEGRDVKKYAMVRMVVVATIAGAKMSQILPLATLRTCGGRLSMAAYPMRFMAWLIRFRALAGCLRASQWTDSGTTNQTIGISAAVKAEPK